MSLDFRLWTNLRVKRAERYVRKDNDGLNQKPRHYRHLPIRLWNPTTGDYLKTLRADRLYEGMNIQGATGLTAAQKSTLKALGTIELGLISSTSVLS